MKFSDPSIRRLGLSLAILSFSGPGLLPAEDWPSWRGPDYSGGRTGENYPSKWTADSVAWRAPLPGKGASCPIIWNERIYLSVPDGGEDSVIAFDLEGNKLWQTKLGAERAPKHKKLGTSCNASPVTDGKGIFVSFKSGNFAALEFDGSIRWQRNLADEFGPQKLYWDQGSSPVIAGDVVVLPRLHAGDSWVAGFDKSTGKTLWQEARDYEVPTENDNAYTTPIPFTHKKSEALLVWGADHLTAHDAGTGAVLWSCGGFNPEGMKMWPAIATPVISGGIIVVPVGRDDRKQARVHGIRLGGEGDVSASHRLWNRDDLGVFVASPVTYADKVYLLRHKGEVVCLDPVSGKTVWTAQLPESKAPYYASPIIAGGILYAAREDGVVFAAKVGEKFELLGENPMGEQILASPVPAHGRLFLRGEKNLFCVE